MAILVEARGYALDAARDLWDFAVEIEHLRRLGLSESDFRWLVCKDYVQHAREITLAGESGRTFRFGGELLFGKRTCFVLSESGLAFAHAIQGGSPEHAHPLVLGDSEGDGQPFHVRPHWDAELGELRLGGQMVKHYRSPAPNQQAILAAFEEEGWPPRIDDPLAPRPEGDCKRRLNDTIKSLNRNQRARLLHFEGDGTGQGVRWEVLVPSRV